MSDRNTPNVLFLFTDDQRFNTIRALGNPEIHTPNLDELVARGVSFTHAHIMGGTSGAVCMPSRAMLMTGRSLFRIREQGQSIAEDHVLMGEAFQQAGYETFGTGKWHNGAESYARSFTTGASIFFGGMDDHWNVPACDFHADARYEAHPFCGAPHQSKQTRMRKADRIECGRHSTDLFADGTCEFLRGREQGRPFFAYVSFMAPHDPRSMPQEFLDLYDPRDISLPQNYMPGHPFDNGELRIRDECLEEWPRTQKAIREHLRDYYAMISHIDAGVGRIVDTLRETGQLDNTILVFAGDNGLAVGSHGLMGKQSLYDHSVRVPLVFAGPGIPNDERRDQFCYLIDIFPTLCSLCGMNTPETVDGLDLSDAMRDPDATVRDVLHTAYTDKHRAVRNRQYKLIEYVVEGERTTQLFDLLEDPHELNNLAEDPLCLGIVLELRSELERWRTELGDTRERFGQTFWTGYDNAR